MSFLTRKYPFPKSSHWLRDCMMYSAIVFLILYLLQPFGFSMYQGNKLLVSLLFGVVSFGCCWIYGLATSPMFKRISPWRVWHETLSVLAMILLIGICNFFVFSFVFHYRNQLETLLNKTTEEQTDITVTIHDTTVRGNDLQLPINDLLYIEAQKNNVMVYYMNGETVSHSEVHTTLSAVLDELHSYENIFQCHRSFVVNLNNITSAQGNSNGYQLKLGSCPTVVPVSRTYVPKLRSFIA